MSTNTLLGARKKRLIVTGEKKLIIIATIYRVLTLVCPVLSDLPT